MSPLTLMDTPSAAPAQLAERVQSLVNFYRHVQTERMQGIPLLNPALQVEAVGFEWANPVESGDPQVAEGVLITGSRRPCTNIKTGVSEGRSNYWGRDVCIQHGA